MNSEVKERVAKLVDPEYHFMKLAEDLRKKLDEARKSYEECLKYGLTGDFYIGPNKTLTYLPDTVRMRRTEVMVY